MHAWTSKVQLNLYIFLNAHETRERLQQGCFAMQRDYRGALPGLCVFTPLLASKAEEKERFRVRSRDRPSQKPY